MNYINELENNNVDIRRMVSEFLSPILKTNSNILYISLVEETRWKKDGLYAFEKLSFTKDFRDAITTRHIFGNFEYTNSNEKNSETGTYINMDWIKLMHSKLAELDSTIAQEYLQGAKEYINNDYNKKIEKATEKYEQATKDAKTTFENSTKDAKTKLKSMLDVISEAETSTNNKVEMNDSIDTTINERTIETSNESSSESNM